MAPSWFASRLREGVSHAGSDALRTLDLLQALPVDSAKRNIAAGLEFAEARGRKPWAHQSETMSAIRTHFLDPSKDPNAIVVMPTGGGKTEIFVRTVESSGLDVGDLRIALPTIVLEPTRQLVGQTVGVFRERYPNLHVGALDGPLALPGSVTVMSYDLFSDMVLDGRMAPGDVSAIVMDEAHRGLSDIRQGVMNRFLGRTVVTAYSATPAFDANKNVYALLGRENEVANVPDERLRRDGVISPVVNYVLRVNVFGKLPSDTDLKGSIIREATAKAVSNFVTSHREDVSGTALRDKRYFGYANGIARSRAIAGMLSDLGMAAEGVSGIEGLNAINEKLGRLASGDLSALVNDQVLIEGTDLPQARGVLAFDPTVSLVKHLQRCGRARRIDPSLDRFDPRQTSSVVEVMVEVNGIPLQDQRIYAEAIGDLSIAKVFTAPSQGVHDLIRSVMARGGDPAGDLDADEMGVLLGAETDGEGATRGNELALGAGGELGVDGDVPAATATARKARKAAAGFAITEDLRGVHYLLGRRDREERPEEYLPSAMAATLLRVTRSNPGLVQAFASMKAELEEGLPPTIGGNEVRAALYLNGPAPLACIHIGDIEALANQIGVPVSGEDHRLGWLSKTQMADNLMVRTSEPSFETAWAEAAAGTMDLPDADDGGPCMRLMRNGNRWTTYLHVTGIPAFEAKLGRRVRFSFQPRESRHLTLSNLSNRLGSSPQNPVISALWKDMSTTYARDGAVLDGNRRVDFDVVRHEKGTIGLCIGEGEVEWFRRKIGMRDLPLKESGWLGMNEAAKLIGTSPYKTPAFRDFWMGLAEKESRNEPLVERDRTWRMEMRRTSLNKECFCLHEDEIPALAAAFDRGEDKIRTEEWLSKAEVGQRLGMDPNRPNPLWKAWETLTAGLKEGKGAVLNGYAFRFEERVGNGRHVPTLHVNDVERLGTALGAVKAMGFKTDEWLSRSELADVLGGVVNDPHFVDCFKKFASMAEVGTLLDGHRPVRFELRKVNASYWCLHRSEVEWFSLVSGFPIPVPKAEHHVSLSDLYRMSSFRANWEPLQMVVRTLQDLLEDGKEPRLEDGRPIRFELTKSKKRHYCFHVDDLPLLQEAVEAFKASGHDMKRDEATPGRPAMV